MPRFISASQAPQQPQTAPTAPSGPTTLQRFLPALGHTRTLGSVANSALGGGQATGGATNALLDGLGMFGGFANMANQIGQGNPVQAAMGGLSGLGSTARLGSNLFTPNSTLGGLAGLDANPALAGALGTAGSALGTVGGLVGGGLALSQGNVPAGIVGLGQGGAGLTSLIASQLGGTAPSLAGAAGPALASGTAGATGATTAAAVGAGLSAVLAPVALGVALHPFFQKWSSPDSDYLIEQRNNAAMGAYARHGLDGFTGAPDLPSTLASLYNTAYAPNERAGTEGAAATFRVGWRDEQGRMDQSLLDRALNDPAAMRQLISTLDARIGQGGATVSNHAITDYLRRELAHRAGITDPTGLFQPAPANNPWDPARMASGILTGQAYMGHETWNNASRGFPNAGSQWAGNWSDPALLNAIDQLTSPRGLSSIPLPIGHGYGSLSVPVSQRFRAPGELGVSAGTRNALIAHRDNILHDLATQADILREYQAANNQGGG